MTTAHSGGAHPVIETEAFVDGTQTSKDEYIAANEHVSFCEWLKICPACYTSEKYIDFCQRILSHLL